MASIFDSCDLPQVPPIPATGWFEDPSIPQAPPIIADCVTFPLPLSPEQPCPTFASSTSVAIGVAVGGSILDPLLDEEGDPLLDEEGDPLYAEQALAGDGDAAGVAQLTIIAGDCCEFELAAAFEFPCPSLPQGFVAGTVEVVEPGQQYARLTITPGAGNASGGGCEFDFGLEIGFASECPQDFSCPTAVGPNPTVALTEIVASGSEYATLTITEDPACVFVFEFFVGFTAGCASFATGSQTSNLVRGQAPSASMTIVAVDGCAYEVDIDVEFVCPSFGGASIVKEADVELVGGGDIYATLEVTESANCNFDFELTIGMPCPTVTLLPISADFDVSSRLHSTLRKTNIGQCEYGLELDVSFPCPQVVQGPVIVQETPCFTAPGGFWELVEIAPCTHQLSMVLTTPQICQDIDLTPVEGGPTFDAITDASLSLSLCQLTLTKTVTTYQLIVTQDGFFVGLEILEETETSTGVDLETCSCQTPQMVECSDCCRAAIVPTEFTITPATGLHGSGEPYGDIDGFHRYDVAEGRGRACSDFDLLNMPFTVTKDPSEECLWVSEEIEVCRTGLWWTGEAPDDLELSASPPDAGIRFYTPPVTVRFELRMNVPTFGVALKGVITDIPGGDIYPEISIGSVFCQYFLSCCSPNDFPDVQDCLDNGVLPPGVLVGWDVRTANDMLRGLSSFVAVAGPAQWMSVVPTWPPGFDYDEYAADLCGGSEI